MKAAGEKYCFRVLLSGKQPQIVNSWPTNCTRTQKVVIAPESVVELFTMRVTVRFAITTLLLFVAGWIAAQNRKTALEEGVERFQRRDFPGAVQAFLKATEEQPSDTRALTYLGMSYAAQEDYKSAVDPLRRACLLRPAEENACSFLRRTRSEERRVGKVARSVSW